MLPENGLCLQACECTFTIDALVLHFKYLLSVPHFSCHIPETFLGHPWRT